MGLCPWAWAAAQGPKIGKMQNAKMDFRRKKISRTFRMARIDPSRQGVMNEASFVLGDINFWPKNEEKVKNVSKPSKIRFHSNPLPIFPLKETAAPHWYPFKGGVW